MTRKNAWAAVAVGMLALGASVAFADDAPVATDAQITDRVLGKLAVDDPQMVKRVQVAVKDGVVTLTGHAYTGNEAAKAMRDAGSVAGVVKVQNKLSM